MRRVEQSLAEEEAKLVSVTDRKTRAEHKLAMAKRELADRSRSAEKLKLDINTLREERTMLKNQVQ